ISDAPPPPVDPLWIGVAMVVVFLAVVVLLVLRTLRLRFSTPKTPPVPPPPTTSATLLPQATWDAALTPHAQPPGGPDNATGPAPARQPHPAESEPVPRITVLGRVALTGWRQQPNRRRLMIELAAFLALHNERPLSGEEIRAAMWDGGPDGEGRDLNAQTLREHLSRLRRCLGREYLPDAAERGGYQLDGKVFCDWKQFEVSIEGANQRRGHPQEAELLRHALELVQGRPFSGVPDTAYSWAFTDHLTAGMEAGIASAAHRLVELGLAGSDPDTARWAVEQGLRGVPTDDQLWADGILVAAARHDRDAAERAWRTAKRVLGRAAVHGPVGEAWRAADANLPPAAPPPSSGPTRRRASTREGSSTGRARRTRGAGGPR
ncbi:MAG: hypothetical protein JOZ04_00670, partial [Acidimicrobiia bacterium]|nr:hypothetical protein [Acidimicrobiia bacterium]